MSGVEDARWDFGQVERPTHEIEAASAVADMQVHDARLSGHEPTDVRVGRDAHHLIERRLARPVVADRHFTDADDPVDVGDVTTHASREGDRREMVSSGVTPGRQPIREQTASTDDELARGTRDIVGAKNTYCSGDSSSRVLTEQGGRHACFRPGFSTSTRQVCMAVDKSGNDNGAFEIDNGDLERDRKRVESLADPENLLAADEEITDAEPVRIEDVRIAKEGEHAVTQPQPPRRAGGDDHAEGVTLLSGNAQRPQHVPSRSTAALASRGWLIPIGGRLESASIVARFVELCGGADAHIVIVPLASRFHDAGEYYGTKFAEYGAVTMTTLTVRNRRGAFDPAAQDLIEHATGVFFTGGNQLKLSTVLVGTPLGDCLRKRHASGMHVAGTSAGAAILSRHMIAFGEEGRMPRAAMVTTSAGLGFTDRFIVDQHFRERDRLGRLLTAVAYNPGLLGLGVDEDTAAFIAPDDVIHVEGSGAVTLVDPSELDSSAILEAMPGMPIDLPGMHVHVIEAGDTFDLGESLAGSARAH